MSEQPAVVVLTDKQVTELVEATWKRASDAVKQREVMTRDECADLLNCDPRTVANWVRDRGLPEHSIGRDKRYRRTEVLRWLEEK